MLHADINHATLYCEQLTRSRGYAFTLHNIHLYLDIMNPFILFCHANCTTLHTSTQHRMNKLVWSFVNNSSNNVPTAYQLQRMCLTRCVGRSVCVSVCVGCVFSIFSICNGISSIWLWYYVERRMEASLPVCSASNDAPYMEQTFVPHSQMMHDTKMYR